MPQAKLPTDEMPRDQNLIAPKRVSVPGHVHEHPHAHDEHPGHEDEHGHEHGHLQPFDLIRIAVTASGSAYGSRFRKSA
jgi:hypothetical protein